MTIKRSIPTEGMVSDRYQIESSVGEGGMATVYRALDVSTGQRVALKRLSDKHAGHVGLAALFEREFLVLSQLSHPRIVAAYDYGVDARGPYYTMELLDGVDLQRMAPVSYRTVCAIGRDVCSALALIHSRRMVYRDLSPQNVRCTADGLAKLIDFGALAPMGPRPELVGTLPCVAPEVIEQAPLDARTDLYAFGATLYYTLLRRHAYPARGVHELLEMWKRRPRMPSELIPEIPRALDTLISDLMEPDPGRRPQSAAEVMERLRAIGELEVDESLQVKSAYLSKPALVGCEQALQTFGEHARRAKEGQGSSLRIAGLSGAGLSRLLESCELQAKLSGWLVLHADANTSDSGDYAGAAALGRALLKEAPGLARVHAEAHLKVLGSVIPELLQGQGGVLPEEFESVEARDRLVQPALREWLARVAEERPLLLGINDVQRLDKSSSAFVALLAREAKRHPMLVVVTQADDQAPPAHNQGALRMLAKVAQPVVLSPLSLELTQSLLGSVFGEVPNLELVARYVQQITGGNPRDVMALAQHLVAEGSVRYEAGSWSLPSRLSAEDLPATMADALKLRVQKLSAHARTLGYAISRETSFSFSVEDAQLLVSDAGPSALALALKELVAAEILSCSGEHYRCVQKSWIVPLAGVLSDAEQRAAHLGLARIFQLREDSFRHASWLLRAGEHAEGLSAMAEFAVRSTAQTDANPALFHALLRSFPEDWLKTCEEALALFEHYQRPRHEPFALLVRLAAFIGRAGHEVECFGHVATMLRQLERDSGLDCFPGLAAELAPGARIQHALGRAQQRYLALPEHERVLDPGSAIKTLIKVLVAALGSIATTSDYAAFRSLPSLVPIVPLAPSIRLMHDLTQGMGHRLGARIEDALVVYGDLLNRLERPNHGLEPAHHFHIKTRTIGAVSCLEATLGRSSCLEGAAQLDAAPQYEHVGAVSRYLFHLWQGNLREARRARHHLELLQLQLSASMDLQHVFSELCGYALAIDMTGVRRAVHTLESVASKHLAARAGAHYGSGEYHAIRGDLPAALSELEQALALMKPGEHLAWANAAGAHVRVLTALDRHEEARRLGEAYLVEADAAKLGYVQNYIRCALSVTLSKRAQHARAQTLAGAAVATCEALRITGLNAELAYETSVLVALAAGDHTSVQRSMQRCSEQFRLVMARRAAVEHRLPSLPAFTEDPTSSTSHDLESAFASRLLDCRTLSGRAQTGLDFVTQHLNATGGVVYLRAGENLVRVAAAGDTDDDSVLHSWTLRHLQREQAAQATQMITPSMAPAADDDADSDLEASSDGTDAPNLDAYTAIALAHYDDNGFALTGILALRDAPAARLSEALRLAAELSCALSQLTSGKVSARPPADSVAPGA